MKPYWSYRAGSYPHTVTAYQSKRNDVIHVRWWDPALRSGQGNVTRRSLGHRSRTKAKRYADEKFLERKWGTATRPRAPGTEPTVGNVLALYVEHETPEKSPRVQAEDRRRKELFEARLGRDTKLEDVTPDDWRELRDLRLAGAIDSRGNDVELEQRVVVRPRVVRAELSWLRTGARWAVGWKVRVPGERAPRAILERNPFEGKSYPLPPDKNPRQPVVTHDVYLELLAVAGDVDPRLPALLRVANGTGRRLSAMIGLWPQDRIRTKTSDAPHGGLRWSEDLDKMGKEWYCPIDPDVALALDELERLSGTQIAPYFPSPRRKRKPVSRDHARKWLLAAYEKASAKRRESNPDAPALEKPAGSCWHVFRRKFVTERPHMSDALVATLAGMSEQTVRIYRQSHPAGLYEALTTPWRLTEVRA